MANKDVYAAEVDKYKVDYWRSDEENVVNRFFPNHAANMLVLGCGAGRTLPYLARKGYMITAVDNVPGMVEAAKEKMRGSEVIVVEMDATKLSFPDASFDYVFFPFHGIDYIHPDIYVVVQEVRRVLKKDGVFVYSSHNRTYLKQLKIFFQGAYADYKGLLTYRALVTDVFQLRKYFKKVCVTGRIALQDRTSLSGKDWLYYCLPWFDKTLYFIGKFPRV
jgi:ubiquinone/menaquinone biosynthesis C-methylase UbiE